MTVETRFDQYVDRSGDCWKWTGGRTGQGYGAFWIDGRMVPAHRVAYELAHGPIPDGLMVCHTCDVRACVNPAHLYAGTHEDNMRDVRDRHRCFASRTPPAQLDRIYAMRANGATVTTIAEAVGMPRSTVGDIVSGRAWRVRPGA